MGLEDSARGVVESLYRDFLLRDLFGKIVPGFIVLVALVHGTAAEGELNHLAAHALVRAALLAGLAWIAGFGVQELGERLRLIRHHPKSFKGRDLRYDTRIRFHRCATPRDRRRAERYAVIKEACGNGGSAILFAVAILFLRSLPDVDAALTLLKQSWPELVVAVAFAIALISANWKHASKQYDFIGRVLGCSPQQGKASE